MTDEHERAERGSPPKMTLAEDRALLDAWCRGDKAAGERLIRYQFEWVSRAVVRWLHGDAATAMDVVQATFEAALARKALIHGPFGPYVRGIAKLKVLEHLRSKDALVHELMSSIREGAHGAESVLIGAQQEHVAIAALRQLSPELQDLMYLRYARGMKLRELAAWKGMTIGRLAGLLRRAEERLAAEVERLAESEPVGRATLLGVTSWLQRREPDDGSPSGRS